MQPSRPHVLPRHTDPTGTGPPAAAGCGWLRLSLLLAIAGGYRLLLPAAVPPLMPRRLVGSARSR